MSNAPTAIADSEIKAENAPLDRLTATAKKLGERIWVGNISTEAAAHLAVIANMSTAGTTSIELRRAIHTWLLAEHSDELRAMSWDDRSSALDWALKPI